jgi:hypothetical protein
VANKARPNKGGPSGAKHRPSATRTERRQAALRRRREETSLRVSQARRATRRRRRQKVLAGLASVTVLAAAVAAFVVLRPDPVVPPPTLRSGIVAGATGVLPMAPGAATYRAVYRVEAYDAATPTVSTEEISVQRPFDGRVVIHEGEPPGGAVQFDGRSTFGSYVNATEGGGAQVAGDAPTVALGDLRLDASLADLVADGTFVARERRQAIGHQCQVYRTGSPLQSLRVAKATASDYVDTCVDQAGLVVEELTVKGGKAVQRITATEITGDITYDPGNLDLQGTPVALDQGGATFTPLDAGAPPPTAGYRALPAPPEGFEYRGRFQLVTADQTTPPTTDTSTPPPPTNPVTSWVDVYVHGIDFVVVRQGPTTAEPNSSDATAAQTVDLGPLGSGRILLGAVGTSVIAHPTPDGFVEVTGTLASSRLQDIIRSLPAG